MVDKNFGAVVVNGAHTPGPWKFGLRRDGSIWLSLGDYKIGPHYQADLCATVADAKLICAAPELLAALRGAKIVLEIAAAGKGGKQHVYLESRAGSFVEVTSALIAIDAAIAKAIGGAA